MNHQAIKRTVRCIKHALLLVLVFSFVTFSSFSIKPQTAFATTTITDTFSVAGYTTWTAPSALASSNVIIACWGGGGAGADATNNNQGGGGGGGGGAFASTTATVSANDVIRLFIGAGGATSGANGGTTTASTTNPTLLVSAAPGWGGKAQVSGGTTAVSLGGATASSTGTTLKAGGNGGGGVDGGTNKDYGGSGGGAGGPHANGNNGTTGASGGVTGGQGDGTFGGAGGTNGGTGATNTNGGGGGGGGDDGTGGGTAGPYGGGGGGSGNGGVAGTFGVGATGACTITYNLTVTTTIAAGADPSSVTIEPGTSVVFADAFTLQTNNGTDSVTGLTVQLGNVGSPYQGVEEVRIVSSNGSTLYFEPRTNLTSNTVTFSGGTALPVTTSATTFKIRITPKRHADMPTPAGAAYDVAPYISAFTSTNTQAGSDTNTGTTTIDNASPSDVTSSTATPGNGQVDLSWTNPGDSDYAETVVLRQTGSAVSTSTFEGTNYSTSGSFSDFSVSGISNVGLGRMSSTTIALVQGGSTDTLRQYQFDGTTWALVGSTLNIAGASGFITASGLSSTSVAYIDESNDSLRTYDFNGSTWSLNGSGLSITSVTAPSLAALNNSDVAYIDSTNDSLRTYRFNGGAWAQKGNSLNVGSAVGDVGATALASLSSTTVAFVDGTNAKLIAYRFNGTDWSQIGNSFTVSVNFYPALTALSSTTVVFTEMGSNSLTTYKFDGTNWSQVGSSASIGGASGGPTLVAINGTDVVAVNAIADSLKTFRFDGVTWSQNKNVVGDATVVCVTSSTSCTDTSLSNGTAYYYKIFTRDTRGNYSVGTVPTGSPATPAAVAPTVTTSAATLVTETGATFNGDITNTGGDNATVRGFANGTTLTLTGTNISTTTESGSFGVAGFTAATSTLSANTTYYFRAYATNPSGTGYGSIQSVLTLAGTPGTPTYSNTIATTTTVTWTAPSGGATTYKLEQCQGASCSLFSGLSGLSTTTYSLIGNTSYDYAVQATNTTGDGVFSATSTVLTLPNIPSALTAGSITATNALLSWTAPTGGASTYKLTYCTGSTCVQSNGLNGISTTTNPLSANTTYTYSVRATNATGDGITSATSTFTTLPDTPGAVSLSNVAATSTTSNWSAPPGGTTSYKLEYCIDGTTTCTLSTGLAVTSTSTNPLLVGNTIYGFAVRGTNATGDGVFTATTTQLTLPNIPGTPTFSNVSFTNLTVSWTGSVGSSTSYKLERCAGDACTNFVEVAANIQTTSYADTNLSVDTKYYYKVRGINATGDGLLSGAGWAVTDSSQGNNSNGGTDVNGNGPTSQGAQRGGGRSGGVNISTGSNTLIGDEQGFFVPSNSGASNGWGVSWTNGQNAYAGTGAYTTAATPAASDYTDFNFSVPNGNTVTGIAVKLVGSATQSGGTIGVELSWNGGTATTTANFATDPLSTSDALFTLGGESSLWGRTWSPSEFTNGNFRLRLIGNPSGNTVQLNAIQVKVFNQSGGGGHGGGSDI